MKKSIIALCLCFTGIVYAQENQRPSYFASNRGSGGYVMNSYGSYFGAIFNKKSGVNTWCLGYSTDMIASSGTCVLEWNTSGVTATITGNASTASALAATPTAATSGNVCRGITASGACVLAPVDSSAVSSSTNPVQSGGMYTALAGKLPIDGSSAMTGGLRPYPRTSAQVATSTPSVVGQLIFNTDIMAYCQGNGTTNAGDWKLVSSTSTACQ